MTAKTGYEVLIVGGGFGGLALLHRMLEQGRSALLLEAGEDIGGVWYWNRYPGARCDVQSMEYSYEFDEQLAQEWHWPELYSDQASILEYLNQVADRFRLRPHIRVSTRVTSATFDEQAGVWTVGTDGGASIGVRYLILATGQLSAANLPSLPDRDQYTGLVLHTGAWPHQPVSIQGKRVGVVGTGSSGAQTIPELAAQAAELTVFQRTAGYVLPAANGPLDPQFEAQIKSRYAEFRAENKRAKTGRRANGPGITHSPLEDPEEERLKILETAWNDRSLRGTYVTADHDPEASEVISDFVRNKIRSIVTDPQTAELLVPKIDIGCKRTVFATDYYATFNLPHVHLVDVSTASIERYTPHGLSVGGHEYPLDVIVFATGYDALTGAISRIDICGRDGRQLREDWSAGPETYLGMSVSGYPNMFMLAGPGSPSALSNVVVSLEQQTEWIASALDYMDSNGLSTMESTPEAQAGWADVVHKTVEGTRFLDEGCNSWYLGSNVPGKQRRFLLFYGFPAYVEICDKVAANDYEGFTFETA